jgi:hypothetical protein
MYANSAHAQMLRQMLVEQSLAKLAAKLGYAKATIQHAATGRNHAGKNLQRDIETLWEQWRQRAAEQSYRYGGIAQMEVEGRSSVARHTTTPQAHTASIGGVQPGPGQAGAAEMTRHEYILNAVQYAKRGNELPTAKLNPEIVREIRENRNGETHGATAKRFGVHYNTVMRIRHFEAWRHVR